MSEDVSKPPTQPVPTSGAPETEATWCMTSREANGDGENEKDDTIEDMDAINWFLYYGYGVDGQKNDGDKYFTP